MAVVENPNIFADKYRVNSSRLNNWDYSNPGYYFITICTYNKNNFFGKIIDEKMELSEKGKIVKFELLKTFEIRKNISLNEWIIMPNHIHILMEIKNKIIKSNIVETPRRDVSTLINDKKLNKTKNAINKWQSNSISSIICQFKSICTKRIKKQNLWFSWQTRFYDRIVKNQKEYFKIKKYIQSNIKNWNKDKYFIQS